MCNRGAMAMAAIPLEDITNSDPLPQILCNSENLAATQPTTSTALVLRIPQSPNMNSPVSQDGSLSPTIITPAGSNPSTAPGSPKL